MLNRPIDEPAAVAPSGSVFDHAHQHEKPWRAVVCSEALSFLNANPAPAHTSVVTSLPDFSETAPLSFAQWREWFIRAAASVVQWVPPATVSIFYQSDIRHQGTWVDKGYLVQRAVEELGATLLWHRIVCRKPPGMPSLGRPSYSHLLCVTRGASIADTKPVPDVLPSAGHMPWSRAMGVNACRLACQYLLRETDTQIVVDPFCGKGTLLAVANSLGLNALGVDLSSKRCRAARNLVIAECD